MTNTNEGGLEGMATGFLGRASGKAAREPVLIRPLV